jgi:predicted NBD/HSP70 family sugar kinase
VENDVNLAALGEYGFGIAKGASSLVCMAIGTGIGAGIILDRKVMSGFHHSAGEVGYLPPDTTVLGQEFLGFGALENLASGMGISKRGQNLMQELGNTVPENGITSEAIFDAARLKEKWAMQVVDETVDYLSLAIAAICLLIDPEVIVLGGGVSKSADILIEPILARLNGVIPFTPRLLQSNLGYRATVYGAILRVLDETTQHVAIGTLH